MRLIDADALMEELEREVELADDWKTAHEIANCVKYAPTVSGWISVKDRKPEASGIYLTWCTYHDIKRGFYRLSEYCAENGGWYDWISRDYGESYVRYWMPLPEPPKEVSEDD